MSKLWVIDTNVLVSALLKRDGACARLLKHAHEGRIALAWTPEMRSEYKEVLSRPKFKFSPPAVTALLGHLSPLFRVHPQPVAALPDPDDEPFLAAALATPSRVLVTGNIKDYPPALRAGVEVISVSEALARLSGDSLRPA